MGKKASRHDQLGFCVLKNSPAHPTKGEKMEAKRFPHWPRTMQNPHGFPIRASTSFASGVSL